MADRVQGPPWSRPNRVAAEMEGNGEFDFWVIYEDVRIIFEDFWRSFEDVWRNWFIVRRRGKELPSIGDQQRK